MNQIDEHFVELSNGHHKVFVHFQCRPEEVAQQTAIKTKAVMNNRNGAELIDVQAEPYAGSTPTEHGHVHVLLTVETRGKKG